MRWPISFAPCQEEEFGWPPELPSLLGIYILMATRSEYRPSPAGRAWVHATARLPLSGRPWHGAEKSRAECRGCGRSGWPSRSLCLRRIYTRASRDFGPSRPVAKSAGLLSTANSSQVKSVEITYKIGIRNKLFDRIVCLTNHVLKVMFMCSKNNISVFSASVIDAISGEIF